MTCMFFWPILIYLQLLHYDLCEFIILQLEISEEVWSKTYDSHLNLNTDFTLCITPYVSANRI